MLRLDLSNRPRPFPKPILLVRPTPDPISPSFARPSHSSATRTSLFGNLCQAPLQQKNAAPITLNQPEASETNQTTCGTPKELHPANSTSSHIVVETEQPGVTPLDALDSPSEPDGTAAFAPSADSRLVSPMDHSPASDFGSSAHPSLASSLFGMPALGPSMGYGFR
ncbi:hypothetical protein RhiJN_00333 [Ceratobasidium sp. AG-Ba]|nr:hypothetical protein RhiJN_00333 [Ceratobasidium sp. AG-Ba]QRW01361.1 hypothetical protein RhiLY_00358 [Ceratobasidium sp. AG-Ba]